MDTHTHYNKYGLALLLFTTFFSIAWIGYLFFAKSSIDLGEFEKGQGEKKNQEKVAGEVKAAGIKEEEQASPWIASEALIKQGAALYQTHCAVCHGPKGLGDGTPGLTPPPRNLVEGKWKKGGSAKDLFTTLQNGMEGTSMVSFKHLSKRDRWALIHYIQSITKNKVDDDAKTLEEFGKTAL